MSSNMVSGVSPSREIETASAQKSTGTTTQLHLQQAMPSLRRGWSTPDPSPRRKAVGLPRCAWSAMSIADDFEDVDSDDDTPRGRHLQSPSTALPKSRTPSPVAIATGWPQVQFAFQTEETPLAAKDLKNMQSGQAFEVDEDVAVAVRKCGSEDGLPNMNSASSTDDYTKGICGTSSPGKEMPQVVNPDAEEILEGDDDAQFLEPVAEGTPDDDCSQIPVMAIPYVSPWQLRHWRLTHARFL